MKTYIDNKSITDLTHRYISLDSTASNHDALLVDTTGGNVNIVMTPSIDGIIVIKKVTSGSNNIIVTVAGGGKIDGYPSLTFNTPNQAFYFLSDGTDFYII